MARRKVLTVQRTIYLTDGMATELDRLAARGGQGCKANNLVREALRALLDEQVADFRHTTVIHGLEVMEWHAVHAVMGHNLTEIGFEISRAHPGADQRAS